MPNKGDLSEDLDRSQIYQPYLISGDLCPDPPSAILSGTVGNQKPKFLNRKTAVKNILLYRNSPFSGTVYSAARSNVSPVRR